MRLHLVLAAAGAIALAACATPTISAADPAVAPGTSVPLADVSRVAAEQPAGAYALDKRHASVIWRLRHMGLALYAGRFDEIDAKLTFDPKNPAASTLTATVAVASVSTGLPGDPERKFDKEIATQVFGSEANPTATFVSKSITLTGPNTGDMLGDLTLRGVTKPVTLKVTFDGGRFVQFRGKHILGFSATGLINRKDFAASLANPMANAAASDAVELLIAGEFIQE